MNNEPLEPNELRELRGLLARLPDAPLPSNFTARVMQAVELEDARRAPAWIFFTWNWRVRLPRFALAAAVVMAAGLVLHQQAISSQRAALARRIALVPAPSVEVLQNFDAIQRMGQPAHADPELLALAPDLK